MGVLLGLAAALMRMSKALPFRLLSGIYVWIFRGTPLLVHPQAARVIIPPLGNEFNNMLKNTSLLFAIGVYEMFADADIGYSNSFQPVEYFMGVAFWYLVLTTVWTFIQAAIERKLAAS